MHEYARIQSAIDMATREIMEGSVESTDVNNAVDHLHEIGIISIA